MPSPQNVNAGNQDKFIPASDTVNPNYSKSAEKAADSQVFGSASYTAQPGSVGSRPGPLSGHGFLSAAERPYAGALEGRFEDRPDDDIDSYTRKLQQVDEQSTISKRQKRYNNYGDVGWAGSYGIDWKVER